MENILEMYLDEIISELARVGRADLIQILREHFNYTTESSEDSDDLSDGEEETIEVNQDEDGFLSLK